MNKNRKLLAQLLKNWAQDHNYDYQIADPEQSDQAVSNTGMFLSWLVREGYNNIDLLGLLDRLELFMEKRANSPDGMYCAHCKSFTRFAESNQSDGSFLCYSCREDPYR